jgi:8-oxo-dGTP diphosphatase
MEIKNRFNIRVYGLLINDKKEVLLSTENINGYEFTKFPGGGLEFGEGTKDCLIREFKEECDIEVEIKKHIYTTDFYQVSAFNAQDQLISIYYQVSSNESNKILLESHLLADSKHANHTILFFWVPLNLLQPHMLTFPIDKRVVDDLNLASS